MAKAQQKKDEPGTQIVVAMIAAAGVIVAGAIGAIGSVVSNKSNGDGQEDTAITSSTATRQQSASAGTPATASSDSPSTAEPVRTMVYVTSVSPLRRPNSRDYVTWKFFCTVRPSPQGQGAVFVLGSAQDKLQYVVSEPVSIAFDGNWVAVVGPIQRDLAWKMTWTATYGIAAPHEEDPGKEARADRGPTRAPEPVPPARSRLTFIAKTDIPRKMLPPQSP